MLDCAAAPPTRVLGRPLERNDCLQSMRGLATLGVLIGHAMYIMEQRYNAEGYELRRFQLGETLIEPFSFCHSEDFLVNTKNIRVMPNDSDVIQAAMVEILDRLDGTAAVAPAWECLQEAAGRIYEACDCSGLPTDSSADTGPLIA
jgi:hypothetical protein